MKIGIERRRTKLFNGEKYKFYEFLLDYKIEKRYRLYGKRARFLLFSFFKACEMRKMLGNCRIKMLQTCMRRNCNKILGQKRQRPQANARRIENSIVGTNIMQWVKALFLGF